MLNTENRKFPLKYTFFRPRGWWGRPQHWQTQM